MADNRELATQVVTAIVSTPAFSEVVIKHLHHDKDADFVNLGKRVGMIFSEVLKSINTPS